MIRSELQLHNKIENNFTGPIIFDLYSRPAERSAKCTVTELFHALCKSSFVRAFQVDLYFGDGTAVNTSTNLIAWSVFVEVGTSLITTLIAFLIEIKHPIVNFEIMEQANAKRGIGEKEWIYEKGFNK